MILLATPFVTSAVVDIELLHPGGVARFPMNFSGNPRPMVTWEKLDQTGSSSLATGSSANSR